MFFGKQIGILLPFLIMLFAIVINFKTRINYKDKKLLFLFSIAVLPIILMFLTSLITGARIRTMWMTSFYLFLGVFFIYTLRTKINLKKFKNFFFIFLFLFIFSPTVYYLVSYIQTNKRTDYPGKKISQIVQTQWDNNFSNKIEIVFGNEWDAGNLSYNLKTRPKWTKEVSSTANVGIIVIGNYDDNIYVNKICATSNMPGDVVAPQIAARNGCAI